MTAYQRKTSITVDEVRFDWSVEAPRYGESCVARAEVSYPIGADGDRRIEWFRSGGLYGIDSPSAKYRREIEAEQFADLSEHLEQFGIKLAEFVALEETQGRTV